MRTVSASYLKSFFEVCVTQGVDKKDLLKFIPGGESAMKSIPSRFPIESVTNILAQTEKILKKPNIGVIAGKSLRPDTFGNVGQAMMVSQTLRHASSLIHRYQPLFQQIGRSYITIEGHLAWNYWDTYFEDPEYARHITEATLISHAQFGRWLTWLHDMEIEFVHFRHAKPAYHELYAETFDCPIHFEQERDAVVFQASLVDTPLPQANQDRLDELCKQLDDALKELDAPKTFAEKTERCTYTLLKSGTPDLTKTAKALHISPRSLRRHLAEEGTSYRAVLEDTRRNLCERLMLEQKMSMAEISERLGYSEQSAFNRAFKKWFGETPKAYAKAMHVFETAFDQMAP